MNAHCTRNRRTGPLTEQPERPSKGPVPFSTLLAAGLIVLATAAAFSNSFAGPFIFDDEPAIPENPTHPPALAGLDAALSAETRRDGHRPPAVELLVGGQLRHRAA